MGSWYSDTRRGCFIDHVNRNKVLLSRWCRINTCYADARWPKSPTTMDTRRGLSFDRLSQWRTDGFGLHQDCAIVMDVTEQGKFLICEKYADLGSIQYLYAPSYLPAVGRGQVLYIVLGDRLSKNNIRVSWCVAHQPIYPQFYPPTRVRDRLSIECGVTFQRYLPSLTRKARGELL